MTNALITRTLEASKQWKTFFNQGNAAGCTSMYEENAQMVAKPFGVYKGRQQIEIFWQELIEEGFADVYYLDPKVEPVDENSTVLTSRWTMNNAQGVISRELWVLQADGSMLLREDHFEAIDPDAN